VNKKGSRWGKGGKRVVPILTRRKFSSKRRDGKIKLVFGTFLNKNFNQEGTMIWRWLKGGGNKTMWGGETIKAACFLE